ncbi:hypothetical protein [Geminocystis herdmanii]|uniref:hypothetical protein n=1 Tax=Geminocystis herdmanii TaxID=669359 RepID=UPI0003486DDB|nr:hypothetical protein [Geminocystis herdmanii]
MMDKDDRTFLYNLKNRSLKAALRDRTPLNSIAVNRIKLRKITYNQNDTIITPKNLI